MQKETFLEKYKRIKNSPEVRKKNLEKRYFLPRFVFWGILGLIGGAFFDRYLFDSRASASAIFVTFAYGYALIYAQKKSKQRI